MGLTALPRPIHIYIIKVMMAAGRAMMKLVRNLSLMRQPCVLVATTVVSLIKDRLSPKNAPPTVAATITDRSRPVLAASPLTMGMRAAMVPTEVPMLSETRQAAAKMPGSSMLSGSMLRVRLTVASTAPMALAEAAKAPARTKIHTMSIRSLSPAPLEKTAMRLLSLSPRMVSSA